MTVMITEPSRPRKRPAVKPAKHQEHEKVKTTVYLTDRSSKMLGVYALMTGSNNSAVLEGLIQEHLRRFVVSDRDRAKSADEAMPETSAI